MHNHESMDHSHHHMETENTPKEYVKFAAVIVGIVVLSYVFASARGEFTTSNFLRMFMGTFFLIFGVFKLLDLKGFATSYMGYDSIAKRVMVYGYVYPFIEIALAAGYFFAVPYIDWVTLIFMVIGSIGVFKELMRGSTIKCACLGTYIKLPLTTVSLIEDVGMGIMAILMILKIF